MHSSIIAIFTALLASTAVVAMPSEVLAPILVERCFECPCECPPRCTCAVKDIAKRSADEIFASGAEGQLYKIMERSPADYSKDALDLMERSANALRK